MTRAEERILVQMRREYVIKTMIERMCKSIEEYISSRREDRYYSDSWEQSILISKDIEKQQNKLCSLQKINVANVTAENLLLLKKLKKNLFW